MTALTLQMVDAAAALIRDTPKVGLYSCRLFPDKQTTSFEAEDGEVFHIASPGFWAAMAAQVAPDPIGLPFTSLCGVPLVNLDLDLEARARVMTAMLKAVGAWSLDQPAFRWEASNDDTARPSHRGWMPVP